MADDRLRPGDPLPATRELAQSLGISRTTVSVAYERLAADGFVASRQGAGTFVTAYAERRRHETRSADAGPLRPRAFWETVAMPTTFDLPARYDFRTGLPSVELFPQQAWRRLVRQALDPADGAAGVYQEPGGHQPLRQAIARHVGLSRGVSADAADVIITSGAQQALDVLSRAVLCAGDRIAVEDPGYGLPRRLFRSQGLTVVPVPVDREGLVVDALDPKTRAVYVTPSHQYPLGVTLSLPRRQALISWAQQHDAMIIEDDYDGEFRFQGRPVDALQALDPFGRVIYVGSFSKVMLPTLRAGFLITPPALTHAVKAAKYVSDWHGPLLIQDALARFIDEGGFTRHLRRAGAAYARRYRRIHDIVGARLGRHLEILPTTAGLHLTAIARRASVAEILEVVARARALDVAFHPLSMFSESAPRAGVALGYGAVAPDDIDEGLTRLARAFEDVMDVGT